MIQQKLHSVRSTGTATGIGMSTDLPVFTCEGLACETTPPPSYVTGYAESGIAHHCKWAVASDGIPFWNPISLSVTYGP